MDILSQVTKFRRELHQIPEIAMNEFKTSKYIKTKLSEFGLTYFSCAETGVIAYKSFDKSLDTIAFRADIDGLNITETTDVDYMSTHDNKMHACGHDGHMAILLTFAKYISTIEHFAKNVLFIFQPAEETVGGASQIVNAGVLKDYNVKSIFGLHILPSIKEGIIGINHGPIMAKTGEFDLTITSKSGHGAMPHTAIDSIYVASTLIANYQSIVSRNVNPIDGAVVSIGTINGGTARNIVANNVEMKGTIRAFSNDNYDLIKERMNLINEGIEKMHGVEIDLNVKDMYPPVINDKKLYDIIDTCLEKNEKCICEQMMISEDFSYYQQEVAGMFFMLGSRNEELGFVHPLHSGNFNFDEKILAKAVEIYIRLCKELGVF